MDYLITIDKFEGPLDLLLHLIKQTDLDIYEIKIKDIIDQYLEYIESMEKLDLNIASEYLSMAAELIEIKSSMLLPRKKIDEDTYEEDPREALINRLLVYKNYKEITSEFKSLETLRKDIYTKSPTSLREYQEEGALIEDIGLNDLMEAFQKFLERKQLEQPLNTKVTTKEYSVGTRNKEIRTILKNKKKVYFTELFESFNKDYVVVTFLSILELAKTGEIILKQDNNFEDILLMSKGSENLWMK